MPDTQAQIKRPTPVAFGQDMLQPFRREMERFFDRFGFPSFPRMFDTMPTAREGSFQFSAPAVDITENDANYQLTAELPGLSDKDIQIDLSGDTLTLQGEKRQEKQETRQATHYSERSYGAFRRSFTLPDNVDRDKIEANFSKGVLTLVLPKTAATQQQKKTIEVKPG